MMGFLENYGKLQKICTVKRALALIQSCSCTDELSFEVYSTVHTSLFYGTCGEHSSPLMTPHLQDVLALVSRTCEYVGFYSKGELRLQMELRLLNQFMLRNENYPGVSLQAQHYHECPQKWTVEKEEDFNDVKRNSLTLLALEMEQGSYKPRSDGRFQKFKKQENAFSLRSLAKDATLPTP